MWHVFQKQTLHTRLFMEETTLDKGGQGGALKACGLGKLRKPTEMYLEWEGSLQVDSPRRTLWSGDEGLVGQ